MPKKRVSLDAVLPEVPSPAKPESPRQERSPEKRPARSVRRPGIKQQTAYLPLPVYEQLRHLAFDEKVKMHALLMEGLDRVFADRGLLSIAELKNRESSKV